MSDEQRKEIEDALLEVVAACARILAVIRVGASSREGGGS